MAGASNASGTVCCPCHKYVLAKAIININFCIKLQEFLTFQKILRMKDEDEEDMQLILGILKMKRLGMVTAIIRAVHSLSTLVRGPQTLHQLVQSALTLPTTTTQLMLMHPPVSQDSGRQLPANDLVCRQSVFVNAKDTGLTAATVSNS